MTILVSEEDIKGIGATKYNVFKEFFMTLCF